MRLGEVQAFLLKEQTMLKAVVRGGEIYPLEPLPSDCREGQPLCAEKDDGEPPLEEIDRDFAVLASPCQASEAAHEEQLEATLQQAHRQAKEQVRRHMGSASSGCASFKG
jgi:nitric oxide reductase activation protein